MPKPKINDRQLLRLVDKEGKTQAEAARKLGVSPQAVNKRLQELQGKTTRVIAAKKIKQVVESKLDSIDQLKKINDETLTLLTTLEKEPALKIRCIAEIRNQIKLQFDIFQTLYSLREAEEFQAAVLETLKEVSPDVRNRVIQKLNEKRAIRSALKFA